MIINNFDEKVTVQHWYQDTRSCVSSQVSRVMHKLLFTRTTNSQFSTPRISITHESISIKFIYFMSSIYANLHKKLERNQPSCSRDICSWNFPIIFIFSSSLHQFTKITLSQPRTPLPWFDFFKFGTPIRHFVA